MTSSPPPAWHTLTPSLSEAESWALSLYETVATHRNLMDAHTVDVFTCSHWDNIIPEQWKKELKKTSKSFTTTDDILFPTAPSTDPGSLHHFLYTVRSHSIPMEWGQCRVSVPAQFGMTPKKSHEVDNFSRYVAQLTSKLNITQVLDVGSGKGYLSQHLSLSQRLCVVGVDAQVSNTLGAHTRNEKVYKVWKSASNPGKLRRNHQQCLPSEDTLPTDTFTGKLNLSSLFNEEESPADYEMEEGESARKIDDCGKTPLSFSSSEDEENKTEGGVDKSAHKISQIGLRNSSGRGNEEVKDFIMHNHEQHQKSNEISKMQATHNVSPHESTFGKGQREEETKHMDLKQARNSTGVSVSQTDGVSFTPLTQLISLANIGEDEAAPESRGGESILEVAEKESGGRFVSQGHTCIVGLHTCGDLGGVALRLFLRQPQLRAVCVVGCCYHHITEEKDEKTGRCKDAGFPMSNFLQSHGAYIGRTGRMLACQAASRVSLISSGAALESVFRRAVLQVLLQRKYPDQFATRGKTLVVGRMRKAPESFQDYVRRALGKLDLDSSRVSGEDAAATYREFESGRVCLSILLKLRAVLASCVESLIVMDRLLFLHEQESTEEVSLVQLFDPAVSPRCFAVTATKKTL